MDDLNDLMLFSAVVTHGSFSQAARALGLTKSLISRRVALLEARLGVRLLQRSTRAVVVTETGKAVSLHCRSMIEASRAAFAVAQQASVRPAGRLRVSCPPGVGNFFLAQLLPSFIDRYPEVRIEIDLANRQVDVIREEYDIAFRVRSTVADSNLVIRDFGFSSQVLVANRNFINKYGPFDSIESLSGVRAGGAVIPGQQTGRWRFIDAENSCLEVMFCPAVQTEDVFLLTQLAISGVIAAKVPFNVCEAALNNRQLCLLLPEYRIHAPNLYAVVPSRKFVTQAVRVFLDFLDHSLKEETSRAAVRISEIKNINEIAG